MALFGRDYDDNYGYRGYNRDHWNENDNRDMGDRMRSGWNHMKENVRHAFGGGYDNGYQGNRGGWSGNMGRNMDYDQEMGSMRGMWGSGMYDRDYGHRMGAGDWGGSTGYNRSTWPRERGSMRDMRSIERERGMTRYGRDYNDTNPMSYDPYGGPQGGYTNRPAGHEHNNWQHDSTPRNTSRDQAFYRGWY